MAADRRLGWMVGRGQRLARAVSQAATCGTLSNLLKPRQARKQFVTPRTANKPNNENKQSYWRCSEWWGWGERGTGRWVGSYATCWKKGGEGRGAAAQEGSRVSFCGSARHENDLWVSWSKKRGPRPAGGWSRLGDSPLFGCGDCGSPEQL